LETFANPEKAKFLAGFFKTGKGQYAEGDVLIGITVPQQRSVAKKYSLLGFSDIKKLLKSKIHEHRLTALFILVQQFNKADEKQKKKIVDFYLASTKHVNNWDLVDLSADKILGECLFSSKAKERKILYKLAKSKNLWERRIAMLATFAFIKRNDFDDALKISELLLKDKHDLIHKAVGWMLREIGKRDLAAEEKFLKEHSKKMPRTMLRYAIEKFPEKKRGFYLGRTNS
jgi:3-methyladenine DNA glycosylase AlkD